MPDSVQNPPTTGASLLPPLLASSVIHLGHRPYYIHSGAQVSIAASSSSELQPATVIHLPNATLTREDIDAKIALFERVDDVFHKDFLRVVLIYRQPDDHATDEKPVLATFSKFGTRELHYVDLAGPGDMIPEGPYFIQSQTLYQTWRLYADTYDAFHVSTIQAKDDPSAHLPVEASFPSSGRHLAIAVPSRLHFPPTAEKPLNGLRIGVKDNIDLQGVRTSGSSRSYFNTYPPAGASAPSIQTLVDLGAVVVGKTGMSQFADAEDPTGDYIDYHAALNPRGDGYRSPGGSSSGSGAAVAAYDWLDFAIGTDTGGSVRVPASYQGVFGLRTSRGALSLDGSLIIHRELDAIGPISRNLDTMRSIVRHWVSPTHHAVRSPKRVLYPTHLFPVHDSVVQEAYDRIVSAAERTLSVTREEVDFRVLWRNYSSSFTTESYEEYFNTLFMDFLSWGSYHERAQFRSDHLSKFQVRPIVNPVTRYRWELGQAMIESQMKLAKQKRVILQEFIESVFLDDAIMLTPFMFEPPGSRDAYRLAPSERDPAELALGLRPAFQTPFTGQPEIVFPVGLINTEDTMSGRTEFYAIMASVIGPADSDTMLVDTVEALLKAAELPSSLLTGRTPWAVDEK